MPIVASNMYINWSTGNQNYDMVVGEWCCLHDTASTYWAFQQWDNGYVGFQNTFLNGNPVHVIILSLWDFDATHLAKVEYFTNAAQGFDFNFGGEGTGKHIISQFNWAMGTWYRIAVGVKSDANNTYYAYWVVPSVSSSTTWTLYGILSIPIPNKTLNSFVSFQEDFANTGELRGCKYSNVFGRYAASGLWTYWNSGTVTSYNENYTPHTNCITKCDCGIGIDSSNNYDYVFVKAGGNLGNCSQSLPYNFSYAFSSTVPPTYPVFPSYIKSYYSGLYVVPSTSNQYVIQGSTKYWWNIEDAGDDYVYILTTDRSKAITITGVNPGDDLKCLPFVGGNSAQKWKMQIDTGNRYYFIPKNAPSMNMDIENAVLTEGAKLQIYTHNTTAPQFKWNVY